MTIFRFEELAAMMRLLSFAAFTLGFATGPTMAATLPYMTTNERLDKSDAVVIAKAASFEERKAVGSLAFLKSYRILKFKTVHIVKGEMKREFEFDPVDYIAEWSTDCCVLGEEYLLFLRKGDDIYLPTNGSFSLIKIRSSENVK